MTALIMYLLGLVLMRGGTVTLSKFLGVYAGWTHWAAAALWPVWAMVACGALLMPKRLKDRLSEWLDAKINKLN